MSYSVPAIMMLTSFSFRTVAVFFVGSLLALHAHAEQRLLVAQSELGFVTKQMGVPVEGRFNKFDAQLAFDPAKPEVGKLTFSVDVGSATLGAPEADAELPKATWFNAAKFPQANFQSSAIKGLGAGKYEMTGKLTVKGAVRDVTVPVTLTPSGNTTVATGQFTVKRLAFKIGEGEWSDTSIVADEVLVKFKLTLSGVGKS